MAGENALLETWDVKGDSRFSKVTEGSRTNNRGEEKRRRGTEYREGERQVQQGQRQLCAESEEVALPIAPSPCFTTATLKASIQRPQGGNMAQ